MKAKKIKHEEEEDHLKVLDLKSEELTRYNDLGKEQRFYGQRLRALLNFYGKKSQEVAKALHIPDATFSRYVNNELKPIRLEVDRICFFFEIERAYFTQPIVEIRITEQLKIELLNEIKYLDTSIKFINE